VACPYFLPKAKSNELFWPFPQRLPLGAGFHGQCVAGETAMQPGDVELRDFCNLGYARQCGNLPVSRRADAIRFSVASEKDGEVVLRYICERNHAPVEHGELSYRPATGNWIVSHADPVLQRQAECYVAVYLERKL
jgi:hypothetical protein